MENRKYERQRFTEKEKAFIDAFVGFEADPRVTAQIAAERAGLAFPNQAGTRLLARPAVHEAILQHQAEMLFMDILPAATRAHLRLLQDDVPAGARLGAVKLAYDRTIGLKDGMVDKEPHEMSPDELRQAIQRIEKELSERSKPVIPGKASVLD